MGIASLVLHAHSSALIDLALPTLCDAITLCDATTTSYLAVVATRGRNAEH